MLRATPSAQLAWPAATIGMIPHTERRRRAAVRLTGEEREGPMLGNEDIVDLVVVGTGALETLNVPTVRETHLGARDERDAQLGDTVRDPDTNSPSTVGMNPAATYSLCPVPEPKFHAPDTR